MKLFRKILVIIALGLPLLALSPAQSQAQAFGEKIILIDFTRVTNESFVGQDVQNQLKIFGDQLTARQAALEAALTTERDKLTEQRNLMDPDQFQKMATDWETKANTAQAEIEAMRKRLLSAGQLAEQELARNLRPIVQKIMNAKGADMVIDKSIVYMSKAGFDVTGEVIDQLNGVITSFPLRLQQ